MPTTYKTFGVAVVYTTGLFSLSFIMNYWMTPWWINVTRIFNGFIITLLLIWILRIVVRLRTDILDAFAFRQSEINQLEKLTQMVIDEANKITSELAKDDVHQEPKLSHDH